MIPMSAPISTAEVIANMLVESTGAHFLDSGGAYGRSWERNQAAVAASGKTPLAFFSDLPEATVDDWCGVTLNIFHYLKERVGDYQPALDRRFRLWCNLDGSDRYSVDRRFYNSSSTVEDFLQVLAAKGYVDLTKTEYSSGGYTYNHENCLSQDFLWLHFYSTGEADWLPEGCYAFISIHGGCDARGGYTDFRPFEMGDNEEYLYDLLDFDCWGAYFECSQCDKHISIDYRHGDVSLYESGQDLPGTVQWGEDENGRDDLSKILCPHCGTPNEYSGYIQPVG